MEPVRILLGRNRPDHQILVQVIRQGQLNQNTMHGGIIVQLVDDGQQRLFSRISVHLVLVAVHADLNGLLALVAHINLGRRVLTHQHNRQTGRDAVIGFQGCDLCGDLFPNSGGKGFSVDDVSSHIRPSMSSSGMPRRRSLSSRNWR